MIRRVVAGFCVILLFASTFVYAQRAPQKEPATKLEQFLAKKGKLIIKDSHIAGILYGQYEGEIIVGREIIVEALTIYEPGKEIEIIRGLRIQVWDERRVKLRDTWFLDMDEVESLSQAITYMITLLDKWKGNNREFTEVIYSTKGDFKVGFWQRGFELQLAFCGSVIIEATTCYFPTGDLSKLKAVIDKGNSLLAQ